MSGKYEVKFVKYMLSSWSEKRTWKESGVIMHVQVCNFSIQVPSKF